jgi:hypothetical protein
MTGSRWGTWWVVGALVVVASGCGEASSAGADDVAPQGPPVSPTAVPAAEGVVRTSQSVVVSDDGSGPQLCFGGISFGDPPACDDAAVTGWDWAAVDDVSEDGGVRWGTYTLTGTYDGETFDVSEVSGPTGPDPYDYEIPCPIPEGGWQVLDPSKVSQEDLVAAMNRANGLDDYATGAVSTSAGEPGPRDPADTVLAVYVAGDPLEAESAIREVWGGMLCVVRVDRTAKELETIQQSLLDVPGMSQVGGNLDNEMELEVFHDDGSVQRWADQEYGEGVVVVTSNLQPVT